MLTHAEMATYPDLIWSGDNRSPTYNIVIIRLNSDFHLLDTNTFYISARDEINNKFISTISALHTNSWWRHEMEAFPRYWPFVRGIHGSPVNSPHKGQWCGALMFPLICAWINGWANNREAGDLRRHRTHYESLPPHRQQVVHPRPQSPQEESARNTPFGCPYFSK